MLSIFLAFDDFSKKQAVKTLAEKARADLEIITSGKEVDILRLQEQDLFLKPKVFVLENLFKSISLEENLEKLIQTQNHVIIAEEKLDKRSSFVKKLLANKNIKIQEFNLPHGKELNKWIEKRVKDLGGKIFKEAAEVLAVRLGRDEGTERKVGGKIVEVKEAFSLWQAESEIRKLLAFAEGREIGKEEVEHLVSESLEIDVFKITNAIADGKKQEALGLIGGFLREQTGSDEKTRIIQLYALLAEQFRNVAMVQSFESGKVPEKEILEKTAWKPGRVFVMKKISKKFSPRKVLEFLKKLENLDTEVKTSNTPPKVLLDLILAQLF